jgi:hypothetical protein
MKYHPSVVLYHTILNVARLMMVVVFLLLIFKLYTRGTNGGPIVATVVASFVTSMACLVFIPMRSYFDDVPTSTFWQVAFAMAIVNVIGGIIVALCNIGVAILFGWLIAFDLVMLHEILRLVLRHVFITTNLQDIDSWQRVHTTVEDRNS